MYSFASHASSSSFITNNTTARSAIRNIIVKQPQPLDGLSLILVGSADGFAEALGTPDELSFVLLLAPVNLASRNDDVVVDSIDSH
jgi:hypothetical protein